MGLVFICPPLFSLTSLHWLHVCTIYSHLHRSAARLIMSRLRTPKKKKEERKQDEDKWRPESHPWHTEICHDYLPAVWLNTSAWPQLEGRQKEEWAEIPHPLGPSCLGSVNQHCFTVPQTDTGFNCCDSTRFHNKLDVLVSCASFSVTVKVTENETYITFPQIQSIIQDVFGSAVASQWKGPGFDHSQGGWGSFPVGLCISVGSPGVLVFYHSQKNMHLSWTGDAKLPLGGIVCRNVSVCLPCDELTTCPGCSSAFHLMIAGIESRTPCHPV